MNSLAGRFNIILILLFCASLGCHSSEKKKDEKDKETSKHASLLHFHLEVNSDPSGHTVTVPVYRASPVQITVEAEPILDEGFIKKIEVVDADEMGGIALKVTFDDDGTRRLDALTIEHRGQRVAIYGVWTEGRWLAAPMLSKRITDGVFIFTPDATRDESERIAKGLKNVIKKLHEHYTL